MLDWEHWWQIVASVVVSAGLIIGITALVTSHDVDYYYVSQGGSNSSAFCAYAHWTWHTDEKAFCSDDYIKVLEFVVVANETLPKRSTR